MQVLRYLALVLLFPVLAFFSVWGTLALWFRLPGPDWFGTVAALLFAVLALFTVIRYFTPLRWRALALFGVVLAAIGIWWQTLSPPLDANWSPQVARQLQGTIDGDILKLTNMRDFKWRGADDYDADWIADSYDLSTVQSADVILSYWDSPIMAHMMVSFGFEDGRYLAWSVEVRRLQGGGFSPISDFFKAHTISYIASPETDLVGTRTNVRKEQVYIYRLDLTRDNMRRFLELYVADANRQLDDPQWFNSAFSNCTTAVLRLLKAAGYPMPMDYRLLANGLLPEFMYDKGFITTNLPLSELKRDGHINARAEAYGLKDGFSQAIRVGLPVPNN